MQLGKVEFRDELRNWNSPLPLNYTAALANLSPVDMKSMFASSWLPRSVSAEQCANMDRQEYENMISLHDKYEPRTQQVYAQFITAFLNNSQNHYLFDIVAPPFQTDELNFHTLKEEIMQVGCDDLEEGGIASEGATSRWGWHDELSRASTRRTISQELALDVNYGAETILKNLADIGQNVVYHCMRNVMHSIREIGYSNIIRETMSDEHVDLSKLYAAEAEAFHIFAKDPHGALKLMVQKAAQFQGDLAIVKEGATQYLALIGKETEVRQIPAQDVTYNRTTRQFTGMPKEGPTSFLSYRLGDRWFDIIENTSWQVSSRSTYREDPLETTTVHGQFYGPNPDLKADDDVVSTNPDILTTILYYQTKTQDGDRKVTHIDGLRNCFRWDLKTGEHSKIADDVVELMNTNLTMSNGRDVPFQYKEFKEYQNGDEEGDYDSPSESAMRHLRAQDTDDFRQMNSIRDTPSGVTFDPYLQQHRNAKRVGDYHLDQTPNKGIEKVVRSLRLRYEEEYKRNMMVDFDRIFTWLENVANAPWSRDYVYALIDANLPKDGGEDYFNDHGVLEFKVNNHHSLKLPPSEDPRVAGMRYTPGFQSGAGMKTVADELLKKGTTYNQMAQEAALCIASAENIVRFLKKYVFKSDVFDYKMAPDWFQVLKDEKETNDTTLIAFIDAIYPSEGPIFFAVPDTNVKAPSDKNKRSMKIFLENKNLQDIKEIDAGLVETSRAELDAGIRALSYLSVKTAEPFIKDFTTPVKETYELIKLINEYSGDKSPTVVESNRFLLNAIAAKFFSLKPDLTAAVDFITKFRKDPQPYMQELKTSDAFKDKTETLNGPLTIWESASAKKEGNRPKPMKDRQRNYTNATIKTKYLRSPLIQSASFRLFVQEQGQDWAWALPGDPNSNYTTPVYNIGAINISFDERNFMSYFQQLSAKMPILGAMPDAFTTGSTGGMTEDDLLELGVPYGESRQSRFSVVDVVKGDEILHELRREYFGPWQNRMEYMDNMNDRVDRVLFKTILEAPDNLFVHEGLAKIGAKLINFMFIRPSITTRSSSVIVMKAGIGTVGSPMSRLIVDLSAEARGYLTITCSFYIGILRVTPSAIALILAAVPVDFVGGKTVSFIKNASELLEMNRDRGSMIVINIPLSETIHADNITLDNGRGMQRPDTYETSFYGKWSGAPILCCIFGHQDVSNIHGYHCDRTQYKCAIPPIAYVLHRGPRSFIDARTNLRVDHEGSGPGGERCMNMSGAYKVMNGTATWYPTVTPSVLTKGRAQ